MTTIPRSLWCFASYFKQNTNPKSKRLLHRNPTPGAEKAHLGSAWDCCLSFLWGTQAGISREESHDPTKQPMFKKKITPYTQQEMKLEEHFPLQTTDPLGLSLQTSQLFEVNEILIKGQPVTHQDIQPSLRGGKWLLQHQPPTSQTQNS